MSVYKPRGSKLYVYDFEHRGRRFCGPTGTASKRDAQGVERIKRAEAAEETKRRAALGREPMSFELAASRYWQEVGQHHRGADNTLWSLDWLTKHIGPKTRLQSITDAVVARIVQMRRSDDIAPATVNRSVTEPLRKVLRRAEKVWKEPVADIAWREHMLKEPRERVRELRADEEQRLFAELRPDYHPIVRFALLTGCRISECLSLRWSDVDWGGRLVWINGKGGKRAAIPLSPSVRALLWPLQGHHPEAVFTYETARGGVEVRKGERRPITREGLKTMWRRRKAEAGIADYRFHDNRHTTATRLLRATGNLKTVARLLRHENIQTTMRYAHVTDNDLMAGMEAAATSSPVQSPEAVNSEAAKEKK